jgi:hypothetical protein
MVTLFQSTMPCKLRVTTSNMTYTKNTQCPPIESHFYKGATQNAIRRQKNTLTYYATKDFTLIRQNIWVVRRQNFFDNDTKFIVTIVKMSSVRDHYKEKSISKTLTKDA